jgi:hypothetical protein
MKPGLIAAACVAAAVLPGCATITTAPTQQIAVTVQNEKGERIDKVSCVARSDKGNWRVDAPGVVVVVRSAEDLVVDCRTEGQPVGFVRAISRVHGAIFGNILIGGVIGALVDHSTGAGYEYPDTLPVRLGASIVVDRLLVQDNVAVVTTAPTPAPSSPAPGEPGKLATPVALAAIAPIPAESRLPAYTPRTGDYWRYQYVDGFNRENQRQYVHEVTAVGGDVIDERMYVAGTREPIDQQRFSTGSRSTPRKLGDIERVEFAPFLQAFGAGKLVANPGRVAMPSDTYQHWDAQGRIVGFQSVTVPAGTFDTTLVEITGSRQPLQYHPFFGAEAVRIQHLVWYAPKAKRYVKYQVVGWDIRNARILLDSYELVEMKLN